jgi:hypothetical protein
MNIALYILAGWAAAGALLTITAIGKPRKPLQPGTAAFIVAANACWIVLLILAARRIG